MQIFAPRPIGLILTGFLARLSWSHGGGGSELRNAWLNVQAHDLDRHNRLGDHGLGFQLAGVALRAKPLRGKDHPKLPLQTAQLAQNTQLIPAKKPRRGPNWGANTPIPVPFRSS